MVSYMELAFAAGIAVAVYAVTKLKSVSITKSPDKIWAQPSTGVVRTLTIMMPSDANPSGAVFGGRILELMEQGGWIAAARHTRGLAMSASLDDMVFREPVQVGEIVEIAARVTHAGERSLEVEVVVSAENAESARSRQTNFAYITYVLMDKDAVVPPLPAGYMSPEEMETAHGRVQRRKNARIQRRPEKIWEMEKDVSQLLHIAMPEDAYGENMVNGGVVLKLIDQAAGVAAGRHCRQVPNMMVVTASIHRVDFLAPVYVGEMLTVQARVSFTSKRSMYVDVQVFTEGVDHAEPRLTTSSTLVFVVLDKKTRRVVDVPALTLESEEARVRFAAGKRLYEEQKAARR